LALEGRKTTTCEKGFTRHPNRTSPQRTSRTTSRRADCNASRGAPLSAHEERPAVVEVVAWAAATAIAVKTPTISTASGACGRSMARAIRFLTKRIEAAEVVDPEAPRAGQARRERSSSDRALCQCRWSGASGPHRRQDEIRSRPQPHQLGLTSGRALMKRQRATRSPSLPGGTEP